MYQKCQDLSPTLYVELWLLLLSCRLYFADNGERVLFKTGNLNSLEIAEEFKVLCDLHERRTQEEESQKKRR